MHVDKCSAETCLGCRPHTPIAAGHLGAVEALLGARAEVDAADGAGNTPLALAAYAGHLSVMEALLAAGADNSRANNRGQHALHAAANRGQTEAAQWLLAHGARLEHASDHGASALHFAAGDGHLRTGGWVGWPCASLRQWHTVLPAAPALLGPRYCNWLVTPCTFHPVPSTLTSILPPAATLERSGGARGGWSGCGGRG